MTAVDPLEGAMLLVLLTMGELAAAGIVAWGVRELIRRGWIR